MAAATGWGVLPLTLSFSGISDQMSKELIGPAQKSAKKAGDAIEKGIGGGAEAAADAVKKASWRNQQAAKEQTEAESKLTEQKLKTEAADMAVEAAVRKRAEAESKGIAAIEKAQIELTKKRAAAVKAARDQTTAEEGFEKALTESSRAAESLADKQKELDKAQSGSEKSSKGLAANLKSMGAEAKGAVGDIGGLGGALEGIAGKAGLIGAGIAGVASLGELVSMGKEVASSIGQMNREMGLTGPAAKEMGDEVGQVLRSGVVAGAEEAAEVVGAMKAQFKDMPTDEIDGLADNLSGFAQTFELEISEATQMAGQLITNGLATDVEHASDLMTAAMQRVPKAMQGELPEIMAEYGVNFANLGLSGEAAFSLLVGQAENGKIALDKTGDALKEFSLFAVDPAKAEAFESIGLNATDMANAVAEGGDKAQAKLKETAQKLLDIEDPGARAAKAIELFGTPLEDLGVEGIPDFLSTLTDFEGGMEGAAGSSQALADSIANSLSGRLNALKGTLQDVAGDGFMAMWDAAKWVTDGLKTVFAPLGGIFADVKGMAAGVGDILFRGDYTGLPFGLGEDSKVVDFLFTMRESIIGVRDILFKGDYTNLIFGLGEDSGVVDFLFNIRESVLETKDNVFAAWDEMTSAFMGGDWGYGALGELIGMDNAEELVNLLADIGDRVFAFRDKVVEAATGAWAAIQPGLEWLQGFVSGQLAGTLESLWGSVKSIASAFGSLASTLGGALWSALQGAWEMSLKLWDVLSPLILPILKTIGAVVGGVVVGAFVLMVGAVRLVAEAIEVAANVIQWLSEKVLSPLIGMVGGVVDWFNRGSGAAEVLKSILVGLGAAIVASMIPALVRVSLQWVATGVQATLSAGKQVAAWVMTSAAAAKNGILSIGTLVRMGGAWVVASAQATAAAVKMAAAWVLGLGPVAWAIGAFVGIGAALTAFFTKTEVGQEMWSKFTTALGDGWDWVVEKIGGGIDWIVKKFQAFTGWISDAWNGITSLWKGDYTGEISSAFGIEEDSPIIGFFFTLRDVAVNTFDTIKENVQIAVQVIKDYFGGVWALLTGDIDGFKGHARSALDGVVEIFSNAWEMVGENASIVLSKIWDSLGISSDGVLGRYLSTMWDLFSSTLETVKQNITSWVSGVWSVIRGIFSFATGDFDGMKEHFGNAFDEFKEIASRSWQTIKDNASKVWENFKISAPQIWNGIKDQSAKAWDGIKSTISDTADGMWTGIKDGARGAFDWASDNEITSGPVNAIAKIGDGIAGQWSEFQGKIQPLKDSVSDLWGTLTGNGEGVPEGEERGGIAGFLDGFTGQVADLQKNLQPVKDAATDLWDVLTGQASEASGETREGIAGMIGTFTDNVAELQEKMQPAKDAVKSIWNALTGKDDEGNALSEEGEQGGIAGLVGTITDKITEFRDAAQPVIDKFKEKWDELKVAMEPMLETVSTTLGDIAMKIGGATLVIAIGLLLSPFIILAGAIYGAVVAANAIADAFAWVAEKWDELKVKFGEGWAWIDLNVIQPFKQGFIDLWNKAVEAVDWIKVKWQELQDKLGAVWSWIDINVIQAFQNGLSTLWNSYVLPIIDWIKGKWDEMATKLESGWNWINDNVFTPLKDGLDIVKGWFETTVDNIGTAWDKIKQKTAEPINFLIREVYMGGIRPAWGFIADLIGSDPLPEMKELGGFANGGVLPGYTPGRDPYEFIEPRTGMSIGLSGGEAVMRPEFTRALGKDSIDHLNSVAKNQGVDGVRRTFEIGHFSQGGIIDSMTSFVNKFFPELSMTSGWRFTDNGMHSRGQAADFSNTYSGGPPTAASMGLARAIDKNFRGQTQQLIHWPESGWQNLLGGSPFNYGGATNSQHTDHVHWGMTQPLQDAGTDLDLSGGTGGGGGGFDMAAFQKGIWDKAIGLIPDFPGKDDGGMFGGVPGGFLKKSATSLWDFAKDKFKSVFSGGSGEGAEQWRGLARTALERYGYNPDQYIDAMLQQIQIESTGDPDAVNRWDSNWLKGTPSAGLLQVIEPTYRDVRNKYPAAFEGLPDDRTEPLTNLVAGIGALKRDWGGPEGGRWPTKDGYHKGGLIGAGEGWIHKTAEEPEMVLSPVMTQAFIDWMGTPQGESVSVIAQEILDAFEGGDYGYAELAHVLRNEVWAKAIVNGAAILGVISRDAEFIAANAELQQSAVDAGRGYAEAQATSLLDVVGLGGLVPMGSSLWDEHGDQAVSTAHSLFGATQNTDTTATASFMGRSVTLEFNAESLDDVVRVGDIKALADQVDGLEVKMNAKKLPLAGMVTRGGVM